MNAMNKDMTAAERHDFWGLNLTAPDDSYDYGQWIAEALRNHLSAIDNIVGVDKVDGPFKAILESAAEHGMDYEGWREMMEDVGSYALTEWRLSGRFYELGFYGLCGVVVISEETDRDSTMPPMKERETHIVEALAQAEAFVRAAGYDQPGRSDGSEAMRVVRLARSRRALDTGEGGVDPASMATLGGWSEGRVRNMMSGATKVLENEGGRIPAAAALAALQDRPAFFDSIWQREDDAAVPPAPPLTEAVFVPVARDDSVFHPGLRRGEGFQIGEKGAETKIDDFDVALRELHRMPDPAWRRPNAAGNWGIVKGIDWRRMERAELEGMTE